MKIIAFFLLASLMIEAVYAEQRLSDIRPGLPCDQAQEAEKRLGSLNLSSDDSNGISRYTAIYRGKKATIVYRCDKGLLTELTIIVTSTTRDEAYQFANEQKIELIKRLGDPIHDGLGLSIWKRFYYGFMGADLDYITSIVVWGREKEDTMLSVRESEPNLWEVHISQGSSKLEYILNS